jgi:transposase
MITFEDFCRIKQMGEEGLGSSQIAGQLGLDRRTISKWIGVKNFKPKAVSRRTSKLDPFKDNIVRMLERYPYTATQIFQVISDDGFDGGYTIVKEYVRKVRPRRRKAFLKLTFEPGECAQVDWGSYGSVKVGSTSRRLSFFVMTMCHSRMSYVEFTVSQTMEHFLSCHQNSFRFFGGIPKKIMVDNLKSAVLKRIMGEEPCFNPNYLAFANHYGFTITPCGVRQPQEKGRVENCVGYVKKNFLAGLEIPDFQAIEPAALNWLTNVANKRIHGETKKRPDAMFAEEQKTLRPVPVNPYDIGTISQVRASRQFRVTLDTNRYSVPAQYSGQGLIMKVYPDRICLYHRDKLIARHPRSYDRHQDFEDPDHPKPLLAERKKARDQQIHKRFFALSSKSRQYYNGLKEKRMNPFHHLQKIVALSEIHPKEKIARAIVDACKSQAFSCEYVVNLLEQRQRFSKDAGVLQLTRSEDLLELEIGEPDMNIYGLKGGQHGK